MPVIACPSVTASGLACRAAPRGWPRSASPAVRCANGPTMAPGPTTAHSHTDWITVASAAMTLSRTRQPGPIRAPAPTLVSPSSWVAGPICAPGSSTTPTSTQVLAGSTIVTPCPSTSRAAGRSAPGGRAAS